METPGDRGFSIFRKRSKTLMKLKPLPSIVAIALLCLVACGPSSGCKSAGTGRYDAPTATYDPAAPADPVVVTAQQLRGSALSAFDLFVTTEKTFRNELWKLSPEIKHAADNVRRNARRWLDDLSLSIQNYQMARTPDNKLKLESAIKLVEQMLAQANSYVQEAQKAKAVQTK